MKTTWIVRWHGTEEAFASFDDALDRYDQLDDRGIRAELVKEFDGRRQVLLA